jgi:hypothetical protein
MPIEKTQAPPPRSRTDQLERDGLPSTMPGAQSAKNRRIVKSKQEE